VFRKMTVVRKELPCTCSARERPACSAGVVFWLAIDLIATLIAVALGKGFPLLIILITVHPTWIAFVLWLLLGFLAWCSRPEYDSE
jgi:hypothetical protein